MDNIIYLMIAWIGALIFIIIGIYAMNRKKPMWLWVGSEIPESKIKDVKAYNRANGKMWCMFSIPFFISGIVVFYSPIASVVIMALACTMGVGLIVWCYYKIEEKYFIK